MSQKSAQAFITLIYILSHPLIKMQHSEKQESRLAAGYYDVFVH